MRSESDMSAWPRHSPTRGLSYIHAKKFRVVMWYCSASSRLKVLGPGMYNSCCGVSLKHSERSDQRSESGEYFSDNLAE